MKKTIVIGILVIMLALLSTAWLGIYNESGSAVLMRSVLRFVCKPERMTIDMITGSIADRLTCSDLEMQDMAVLPSPNSMRLHRLICAKKRGFFVGVDNGRIRLPRSNTIVFSGTYETGEIDARVYCAALDLDQLVSLFKPVEILKKNVVTVEEMDFDITGTIRKTLFSGSFFVSVLKNENLSLYDVPATFSLSVHSRFLRPHELYGELIFGSGRVVIRQTQLAIQKSRIVFDGDMRAPQLDLAASTVVDGVAIDMTIKGTPQEPELLLRSQPEKTQTMLLIMIATGKSWKGIEPSLDQARISPDLALDFIDFVFFGGSFSHAKKKLGITEFSIDNSEEERSLRVKKQMPLKTEVGYAVEQQKGTDQDIRQKIGAEYSITDSVSIEGQTEIRSERHKHTDPEDTVMLKFNKQF